MQSALQLSKRRPSLNSKIKTDRVVRKDRGVRSVVVVSAQEEKTSIHQKLYNLILTLIDAYILGGHRWVKV